MNSTCTIKHIIIFIYIHLFSTIKNKESTVFDAASDLLVNKSRLGPAEVNFLTKPLLQRCSNVRIFGPGVVTDLLQRVLPRTCFASKRVEFLLDEGLTTDGHPHKTIQTFIRRFWRFVTIRAEVVSAVIEGAALVPVKEAIAVGGSAAAFHPGPALRNLLNDTHTKAEIQSEIKTETECGAGPEPRRMLSLLPLSRLSSLLSAESVGVVLSDSLQRSLQLLGVNIVDHASMGTGKTRGDVMRLLANNR
jgi:hypothetical protein